MQLYHILSQVNVMGEKPLWVSMHTWSTIPLNQ